MNDASKKGAEDGAGKADEDRKFVSLPFTKDASVDLSHANLRHRMYPPSCLFMDLTIHNRLSSGAFASVYLGKLRDSYSVAIKVMVTDEEEVAVRLKEALLPLCLSHPHVVATYTTRTSWITGTGIEEILKSRQQPAPPLEYTNLPPDNGPRDRRGRDRAKEPSKAPDVRDSFDLHGGFSASSDLSLVIEQCSIKPHTYVSVIAMELCDKGTLLHAISSHVFTAHPKGAWSHRIGHRALVRTALEICAGLMHLHACGVVHGDLKPGNILLADSNRDKRGFVAKLADFGLSHIVGCVAASIHTNTWGTPHYMAPEHLNGRVVVASDVYSFGAVLLQMMTAKQPYLDMAVARIVAGVASGELQPHWPSSYPVEDLCRLGARCTAFREEERPTLEEIEATLQQVDEDLRRRGKDSTQVSR